MTDAQQRELLEAYRPWLRTVARNMCGPFPSWAEDCAQEGWIAIWRGLGRHDPARGPRDAWLKHCACQRMAAVIRSWQAQCRDTRITHLIGEIPDTVAPLFAPETVELGYHEGDLLEALNALDERQRRYVELRFWGGLSHEQMRAEFGRYGAPSMWRWIRPQLKAALEASGG